MPSLCNVLNKLSLQLNSDTRKILNCLVDLLFLHDFLVSRREFKGNLRATYDVVVRVRDQYSAREFYHLSGWGILAAAGGRGFVGCASLSG